MSKALLLVCVIALLASAAMGESAIEKLKAKVAAGTAAAPCDKAAAPAPAAAAPKPFLDIRLPVVVDDYHPPAGGFNPSDIPDHEVDVAARKILREMQKAQAEAKANGDEPAKDDGNVTLTPEEHAAMKQLLLDADILVRAANKLNAENGPITVAQKAVKAAAAMAKNKHKKVAAKQPKKGGKKNKKAPAKKSKKADARPTPKQVKMAAPKPQAKHTTPPPPPSKAPTPKSAPNVKGASASHSNAAAGRDNKGRAK